MIEEKIEIPLADGTSEAFLYHAETGAAGRASSF